MKKMNFKQKHLLNMTLLVAFVVSLYSFLHLIDPGYNFFSVLIIFVVAIYISFWVNLVIIAPPFEKIKNEIESRLINLKAELLFFKWQKEYVKKEKARRKKKVNT